MVQRFTARSRFLSWFATVITLLLPAVARAQESPRVEVFAGYSHLGADYHERLTNLGGWMVSGGWRLSDHVRVVGMIAKYETSTSIRAAGVHFFPRFRTARPVEPFGIITAGTLVSPSRQTFALTAGAGIDRSLTQRLAFRILQADYVWFDTFDADDSPTHTFRLSTGLVLRLGR